MTTGIRAILIIIMLVAVSALTAPPACGAAADFGFETSDQKAISLVGSIHLHNAGSAPAEDIEIKAYLPRNLIGQTIFALDFIPRPHRIEADPWTQKIATWKVSVLAPGEHVFVMWIARAASSEVKYDVQRLRRGNLPIPVPIRSLYLWGETDGTAEPCLSLSRRLAQYVRKTASQELSGLPFDLAIPRPEDTFAYAEMMTRLCHANGIPCRTVGAYVRTVGADFSVDLHGAAWNEVYFPQSGWVPMSVTDRWEFGRKHNNYVVVKTIGHTGESGEEFWGSTGGGGGNVRAVDRGYFSTTRDFQQESEMIKLFQSLRKADQPAQISGALLLQGKSGEPLALGLLEPYLYHADAEVAESAATAVGSVRQNQAALMLVDAMGRSPETDTTLMKQAESLTGRNFGTDKEAWRDWILRNIFPASD